MKKTLKIGLIISLFLLQACPGDPCDYKSSIIDYTVGMEDEFTITPSKKTYKVGEQIHVTLIIKADKARVVDKPFIKYKYNDLSQVKPTDEIIDIYPIIGDFVFQDSSNPYYMSPSDFSDFLLSNFESTVKLQQKLGYHQDKEQYIYDAIITLDASRISEYSFKQGETYLVKAIEPVDCHPYYHMHIINLPKAIEFEVVE